MTIQEIKALPRTEEGIFDLKKVQADAGRRNIYQAADLVYPTENGADYTAALLHTVEQISPEIYENYRELLDNFRGAVKRMLEQYYDVKSKTFAMDETSEKVFCGAVQKACGEYLLLAEKYQECMR